MTYYQEVVLPHWDKLEPTMHNWGDADVEELPHGPEMCCMVIWHHDKLTYYANDWCKIHWVHQGEQAVPYAKGEGVCLMVTDFDLADYGWLHSPDGSQEASWEGPGRLFHQ